jgi:hypothetical protein
MAIVTMATRKEIVLRLKPKYAKGSKKEKGQILDGLCADTGLSRSRAKHLLCGNGYTKGTAGPKIPVRQERRGRKPSYGKDVAAALETVWACMDFCCGRRLAAGMGDILDALVRFGEVEFSDEVLDKLRKVSPSTIDRFLAQPRRRLGGKGRSTTKPGTLLKKDIPLRLGTEWEDAIPGYVEVDLVAHCGDTTAGEYIHTLDVTDICTGWTETEAVLNKAQRRVFKGLMNIEQRQPFPYLGIDSDNGSEFINNELYRYCEENGICFTRSRPYQKNDNCHVEQKNWNVIRRNIGYGRYEGQAAVDEMNHYYSLLRLYTNFFLPQTKLISRTREGSHIRKTYETPLTPFRRTLDYEYIPDSVKEQLNESFLTLNPVELKRGMMKSLEKLEKLRIRQ